MATKGVLKNAALELIDQRASATISEAASLFFSGLKSNLHGRISDEDSDTGRVSA